MEADKSSELTFYNKKYTASFDLSEGAFLCLSFKFHAALRRRSVK